MQNQPDIQQAQEAARQAQDAAQQAAREASQEGNAVRQALRDVQQGIRDGMAEGGPSGAAGVEVRNTESGRVILITDAQGNTRRIEISNDGQVVSSTVAGVASTAPPPPPPRERKQLPVGLVEIFAIILSAVTLMTLGAPIVQAWTRRFDKRHEVKQQLDLAKRLEAIEQAIDSVAVEVERISEGQRFTTKLLADRAPAEMERVR